MEEGMVDGIEGAHYMVREEEGKIVRGIEEFCGRQGSGMGWFVCCDDSL